MSIIPILLLHRLKKNDYVRFDEDILACVLMQIN